MDNNKFPLSNEFSLFVRENEPKVVKQELIKRVRNEAANLSFVEEFMHLFYCPLVVDDSNEETLRVSLLSNILIDIRENAIEVFNFDVKEILNAARDLNELVQLSGRLDDLLNTVLSGICGKEIETDLIPSNLWKHQELYEDLKLIDKNLFFSYDDGEEVYFYLPAYDVFVSTHNDFSKQPEVFMVDALPLCLNEDEPVAAYYNKGSVSVAAKLYGRNMREELLNKIKAAQMSHMFSVKETYALNIENYTSTLSNFIIAKEITASTPVPLDVANDQALHRVKGNKYLLFSTNRQAFLCENIREAFEYIYRITTKEEN